MKPRNKTIRVFLSSTFEDLKMERDALQQKAFRNLREYCRERGWQFQAVDEFQAGGFVADFKGHQPGAGFEMLLGKSMLRV